MLQANNSRLFESQELREEAPESGLDQIRFDQLIAAARRQYKIVIAGCVVGAALAVGYVATAVPRYTATALILMDNRKVRAVENAYDLTAPGYDTSIVDSQVEVLKSDKIALGVISRMKLLQDPEFAPSETGLIAGFLAEIRSAMGITTMSDGADPSVLKTEDPEYRTRQIVAKLKSDLDVRRVGRTLVLEIGFTSPDPAKAASIANAYSDAYLDDQLDSKYDATRRASAWLQDRMEELRKKALASDLAIQKFKADNNLISAGGKLVNEQQLAELNSQLILARSETARAEARYQRIRTIVDTRQTDAVVTDQIGNNVIEGLRTKFLTASKREAEITNKLGANHVQAVNLRNEMREYERLMFDELGRLAESYKSDLDIARSREKSLEESLSGLVGISATANETLVQLRELEREADTYKNLYQNFLQRYQEAVQQQSFPITEARVITQAAKPTRPSFPKKSLVLALGILLGTMAGAGVGALREFRDRVFRTGAQVRDELDLEFMGMLPMLEPAPVAAGEEANNDRAVRVTSSVYRHVLDHPLSGFAEALRATKVAADLTLADHAPKVIGILSVLPGEGKSTVAKNFATLLAHQGARTLLIDGDLRNPGLTRGIARHAQAGLIEAVVDDRPLQELLMVEPGSKLVLLPAVVRTRVSHTSEMLASSGMKSVLRQAGQHFDYVVIDLPPLGPVVDARAVAPQIDAFLFVVEWGKTARSVVRTALSHDRAIKEKCLGVVLNKVLPDELRMYESYGSKDYYYGKYSNYYRDKG